MEKHQYALCAQIGGTILDIRCRRKLTEKTFHVSIQHWILLWEEQCKLKLFSSRREEPAQFSFFFIKHDEGSISNSMSFTYVIYLITISYLQRFCWAYFNLFSIMQDQISWQGSLSMRSLSEQSKTRWALLNEDDSYSKDIQNWSKVTMHNRLIWFDFDLNQRNILIQWEWFHYKLYMIHLDFNEKADLKG